MISLNFVVKLTLRNERPHFYTIWLTKLQNLRIFFCVLCLYIIRPHFYGWYRITVDAASVLLLLGITHTELTYIDLNFLFRFLILSKRRLVVHLPSLHFPSLLMTAKMGWE